MIFTSLTTVVQYALLMQPTVHRTRMAVRISAEMFIFVSTQPFSLPILRSLFPPVQCLTILRCFCVTEVRLIDWWVMVNFIGYMVQEISLNQFIFLSCRFPEQIQSSSWNASKKHKKGFRKPECIGRCFYYCKLMYTVLRGFIKRQIPLVLVS